MINFEPILAVIPVASLAPYWHFVGVFHPAVTHFPIALLMVAALVESWSVVRRQRKPLHTTLICLYLGTAAAVVATTLGWASADASGEKGELVDLHRWLGVAVAVLAILAVAFTIVLRKRDESGKLIWGYRGTLFATAALVGLVGSYGGKLVHGANYYNEAYATLQAELKQGATHVASNAVEEVKTVAKSAVNSAAKTIEKIPANVPTASASPATAPTIAQPVVVAPAPPDSNAPAFSGGQIDFARDIEPIFVAHCIKCHSETKKKGGYRLDSKEHVFAAGDSGKSPIVPGKSDESLLVKMIEGKNDFEDSMMPPKGEKLSFQQITLIRKWIDEGAHSTP